MSVERFRKLPVVIEAVRWDGTNIKDVLELAPPEDLPSDGVHVESGYGHVPATGTLDIPTLEGVVTAQPGDWIIKGVAGEVYPCKPDIFDQTYEPVDA